MMAVAGSQVWQLLGPAVAGKEHREGFTNMAQGLVPAESGYHEWQQLRRPSQEWSIRSVSPTWLNKITGELLKRYKAKRYRDAAGHISVAFFGNGVCV